MPTIRELQRANPYDADPGHPFGTPEERDRYEKWAAENRRICGIPDGPEGISARRQISLSTIGRYHFQTPESRDEFFAELAEANAALRLPEPRRAAPDMPVWMTPMGMDEVIEGRRIVDDS